MLMFVQQCDWDCDIAFIQHIYYEREVSTDYTLDIGDEVFSSDWSEGVRCCCVAAGIRQRLPSVTPSVVRAQSPGLDGWSTQSEANEQKQQRKTGLFF